MKRHVPTVRLSRLMGLAGMTLFLCLSTLAHASGFNYTYVGGGYISDSPSGGSSGNGLFLTGSYNFQNTGTYLSHMDLVAGYSHLAYGGDVSANDYDIGLGGHFSIRSVHALDVVVRALYLHSELGLPGPVDDIAENGFGLAGGVRWAPLRRFEFDGLLEHDIYGCTGCQSVDVLSAQGQYHFTPHFAALVSLSVGDNNYGDVVRLGVHYFF